MVLGGRCLGVLGVGAGEAAGAGGAGGRAGVGSGGGGGGESEGGEEEGGDGEEEARGGHGGFSPFQNDQIDYQCSCWVRLEVFETAGGVAEALHALQAHPVDEAEVEVGEVV